MLTAYENSRFSCLHSGEELGETAVSAGWDGDPTMETVHQVL